MAEKVNSDDIKRKKYEKLVEDYYVKKGKYEKKIVDFKKSKKFKVLSLEQKKESLANFKRKMKCINCNKPGGTLFSKVDNHLIVKCGNTKEPCKLNIDIKCASTTDAQKTLDEARISINSFKRKITELKLDLLFELDDEEVILNEFQTYKDQLQEILEFATEFQTYFDRNNNKVAIVNEETGENTYISKKEILKDKQKELNQIINTFKKNIKEFKETGEISFLTDTLQIYKNVVIPLQNQIRNLKYQEIIIEKTKNSSGKFAKKEMPTYHFTKTILSDENKIIKADDFEIIQNIQ
tara:strand:+ start:1376 stop:2260 length:885 start_codon:yes stop_codon:yes gene_type:complete